MPHRIVVLIMDSVGIGEQPDAIEYNSIGANTFHHAAQSCGGFRIPNLQELGFGNILGVSDVPPVPDPKASYGRMTEITSGNDTFAGVWEMAGVVFKERFTSFSPQIPDVLVEKLQESIGTGTLCNAYISGFKALDEFADEHFASKEPIVYTCDDGVVLVAAHEDILDPNELRTIGYKMSRFFVSMNVSRIIARPFVGAKGHFIRTENRRDFIVPFTMHGVHLFQRIKEVGVNFTTTEHLTSLIGQDFVTETIPGIKDSMGIMDSVCEFLRRGIPGISMFVVPDFDMSGHRKEPETYASDLILFDRRLGEVLELIGQQDILVIVADHGCDPVLPIRGHTREYVPLLVLSRNHPGQNLGTRETFADLGQTICELICSNPISVGKSFAKQITRKEWAKVFDSKELAINGGKAIYTKGLKRGRVFGDEEKHAVLEVMEKGVVSRAGCGEKVQLFERSFGDYHGVRYAIATTSGTTALHTALDALGIRQGDEVIVPDLTFISTASAVMQTGAQVVFCDIDVDTFNISVEDLERRITPKTKAVIVVHLYGAPADIASILAVTRRHNLWLVEDCAQAHGAKFNDRLVGTFGVISCFSFYQSKNMSCGEGGMVITNDENLGRRARSITRHGLVGDDLAAYNYDKLGYNYAMTELQAAIGIVQLNKLEQMNEQRRINAALYRKELTDINVEFQRDVPGHTYHYLTAVLPELYRNYRNKFLTAVRAEGAMINCLYPIALSRTKLFATLSDKPEISDRVASTLFNLYVNPDVCGTFVKICCDAINKVLKSNKGG